MESKPCDIAFGEDLAGVKHFLVVICRLVTMKLMDV